MPITSTSGETIAKVAKFRGCLVRECVTLCLRCLRLGVRIEELTLDKKLDKVWQVRHQTKQVVAYHLL
jgi:hypothetical protein